MSEKFRTVDLHCEECCIYYSDMVKKEESAWGTKHTCASCGNLAAVVVPSIPIIRGETSQSHVSGVRSPKRDAAIKRELEALDLEIEAADKPYWERGEIEKEIKKVRGDNSDK